MKENKILNGLMFDALDHGIWSIEDGGNLIPFVMTLKAKNKGKKELTRFLAERLEQGYEEARSFVAKEKPDMYAIVYEGYSTIENKKYDSILVIAGENGKKHALHIGQRYQPKKLLGKFKKIGNPIFFGEVDNILK